MDRIVSILLFSVFLAARCLASDDPVVTQQKRAAAAALVILVQTEPVGDKTRLKIVEFWKRNASETDISRYFANGYLPVAFPSRLAAGQQIVVYYNLPASGWDDPSNLSLGPGRLLDGKFMFNQHHESKPKQEYSVSEMKQLLVNNR